MRAMFIRTTVCGSAGGVALGFRRLSIIDVAGGRQPLANEDDTIWIVFNGEIYNFRDLAPPVGRGRASVSHRERYRRRSYTFTKMKVSAFWSISRGCSPWRFGTAVGGSWCWLGSAGKEAAGVPRGAGPAAVRQRAEELAGSARRSREIDPRGSTNI